MLLVAFVTVVIVKQLAAMAPLLAQRVTQKLCIVGITEMNQIKDVIVPTKIHSRKLNLFFFCLSV